ncbi:hypothetical protein [Flagellimonas allohymeniacidonis]|uniref:Uncharacterized protein n=1 Tax=Flagellimonas allohymeniacidonis TaxID=2517819 RepID=A0A4Q8QED4_9FLAO|nr:hypothetical protein [Allomuricauda hymeniacidonis]TAI48124.1 hypothetical protein EW142_15875 [Allomuricauda hymeniacidonis]
MARLTSKQINELANTFLTLAQSIGDYRMNNFDTLTKAQNRKLRESHRRILNYSDDFYTISATLVMNDVEDSLARIAKITEEITKTYKSLQNVQKAINIAASVVTVGASIFSKSPLAILDALGKLEKTWNA